MPMTADETRRRLGVAQIEALFGSVPVGVGAAAVASVILAAGMGSLGFVELWTGVAWVGYLQVCAYAISRSGSSTSARDLGPINGASGLSGLPPSILLEGSVSAGRRSA